MKKFACIVLAVLMLTLLLAGCGKKTNGNTTDTSSSETEDRKYLDDVPESVHFNGDEIRFAVCEAQNGTFSERSLGIEDYAGNKLDEEVHKRNLVIEQRLGLYIKIEQITGYKNFTDTVTPVLFSGTDAYDILMGAQYFDVALASKGYLLDINTLAADGHGYINTDKAYGVKMEYSAISV